MAPLKTVSSAIGTKMPTDRYPHRLPIRALSVRSKPEGTSTSICSSNHAEGMMVPNDSKTTQNNAVQGLLRTYELDTGAHLSPTNKMMVRTLETAEIAIIAVELNTTCDCRSCKAVSKSMPLRSKDNMLTR